MAEALQHNCTLHTLNIRVREAWQRWRMALQGVGVGGTGRDWAVVLYARGSGMMRGEECDGSASGHELTMWHWVGVGERDRSGRSKKHSGSASPQLHSAHALSWGTSSMAEMDDGIGRGWWGRHGE